jgi:hypothetical protein
MKKAILFASAIICLSLASCKKDRVCECTSTSSGGSLSTSTITIKKIKKSEAKTLCQNHTYTSSGSNQPNQTDVTNCTLK